MSPLKYFCSAVLLLTVAGLGHAASLPQIELDNQVRWPVSKTEPLLRDFRLWAVRLQDYLGLPLAQPIRLQLIARGVGMYVDDAIQLPVDEDADEMLETWVHELAHYATGHDSSFFFKEGIASHSLEAVFAREQRIPQGWPQYGERLDAWVALFERRGQRLPLRQALAAEGYDGSSAEGDYRSWQIYILGGSFTGWYRNRFGDAAFRRAFAEERPAGDLDALERRWLTELRQQNFADFDPALALPKGRRYQNYARRLRVRD